MSDLPENPYLPPSDYLQEEYRGDDPFAEDGLPLTVSEAFRGAWAVFSKWWLLCVGGWLLAIVLACGFLFGGVFILIGLFGPETALPWLVMVSYMFFGPWLYIGVALICLRVARGDRVSLATLFSGGRYVGNILVGSLLFMTCFELGLILLIVPGVFFVLMFAQWFYLILDGRESTITDAFTQSRIITEGRLWALFKIFATLILAGLPMGIPFFNILYMLFYIPFAGLSWRWSISD